MVEESWVDVEKGSDFTLQNLPFGVFSTKVEPRRRCGVAIGHYVLDLKAISPLLCVKYDDEGNLFDARKVFSAKTLNPFMECGKAVWTAVVSAEPRKISLCSILPYMTCFFCLWEIIHSSNCMHVIWFLQGDGYRA